MTHPPHERGLRVHALLDRLGGRARDLLDACTPGRLAAGLSVALVLTVIGAAAVLAWLTPECAGVTCPSLDALDDYRPPEPPHVYDQDGELVGHLPGPERVVVPLDRIPPLLKRGFIAVEDRRFREHGGVDLHATFRAFMRDLRAGRTVEGASTITMQLARNIFARDLLSYSPWHRKASEVRLALAIEHRLSKDRILELYLNQIYLGDGVYGVGTAALDFFGKPAEELDAPEAALIIGLAKNPEGYNPRNHPDAAVARRNVVLDVLAREGVIRPELAREAEAAPLVVAPRAPVWRTGSYYAAAVRRELEDILPDPERREGVRVYTGLDPSLQMASEKELVGQIRRIESGRMGRYRHPIPGKGTPPDSVGSSSPYLQGMVVALDAATGEVRALVGGRDYSRTQFDRAFLARRQPGSAFKPIMLAAALSDSIPLTALVRTDSITVPTGEAGADSLWHLVDLRPDDPTPRTLTLRDAIVHSSNVGAVRTGMRTGVERVIQEAHTLGITTSIPPYPSLFLGTAEVEPAQLVAAFATFDNGGYRVEPHLIDRIEDPAGDLLWQAPPPPPMPVLDPRIAFLVRSVLEDVVDRGTGWRVRAQGLTGPAAGKTGTTNGPDDVWFVGMRPGLVAGVWFGFDQPRTILSGASGGLLAAPVWSRIMMDVPDSAAEEDASWDPPPGLLEAEIDGTNGYLATAACPESDVRTEYFLPGTAPRELCPIHSPGFVQRLVSGIRGIFGGGPQRVKPVNPDDFRTRDQEAAAGP